MSKDLIITRVFDAPRELVWKVWTNPEYLAQWWGPETFTARINEQELKQGGKWNYTMLDQQSKEYPSEGVFQEIVEFEKIVTTDDFGDDFRNSTTMDLPQGIVLTVKFEDEVDGKTKLTLHISHPTEEDKDKHVKMGVIGGWNSSLNKFESLLNTIKS